MNLKNTRNTIQINVSNRILEELCVLFFGEYENLFKEKESDLVQKISLQF